MKPNPKVDLFDAYRNIKDNAIQFFYCGPISQDGFEGIAVALRRSLSLSKLSTDVSYSIFSVFVEQIQNAIHYSSDRFIFNDGEMTNVVVMLGDTENGYYMQCGNKVHKSDKQRLADKINQVNGLTKDELKQLYKERRKQPSEPQSKGAGLGLIEMARRSDGPIAFSFADVDDECAFFTLYVTIGGKHV